MLTDAQLAAMRVVASESLPDRARVERRTSTPDGAGGWSESWVMVLRDVPCRRRLVGPNPYEHEIANVITEDSRWIFTFPHNVDIRIDDRIIGNDDITFDVVALDAPRSFSILVQVLAIKQVAA